jgi:hypothetical protein
MGISQSELRFGMMQFCYATKMQKEVKRPNQISIKFNTTQIERSTL